MDHKCRSHSHPLVLHLVSPSILFFSKEIAGQSMRAGGVKKRFFLLAVLARESTLEARLAILSCWFSVAYHLCGRHWKPQIPPEIDETGILETSSPRKCYVIVTEHKPKCVEPCRVSSIRHGQRNRHNLQNPWENRIQNDVLLMASSGQALADTEYRTLEIQTPICQVPRSTCAPGWTGVAISFLLLLWVCVLLQCENLLLKTKNAPPRMLQSSLQSPPPQSAR